MAERPGSSPVVSLFFHDRWRLRLFCGVIAACLLPAGTGLASGFAVREQSASALGNAYAGGAAAAEDPSYMFYNPAALAL